MPLLISLSPSEKNNAPSLGRPRSRGVPLLISLSPSEINHAPSLGRPRSRGVPLLISLSPSDRPRTPAAGSAPLRPCDSTDCVPPSFPPSHGSGLHSKKRPPRPPLLGRHFVGRGAP